MDADRRAGGLRSACRTLSRGTRVFVAAALAGMLVSAPAAAYELPGDFSQVAAEQRERVSDHRALLDDVLSEAELQEVEYGEAETTVLAYGDDALTTRAGKLTSSDLVDLGFTRSDAEAVSELVKSETQAGGVYLIRYVPKIEDPSELLGYRPEPERPEMLPDSEEVRRFPPGAWAEFGLSGLSLGVGIAGFAIGQPALGLGMVLIAPIGIGLGFLMSEKTHAPIKKNIRENDRRKAEWRRDKAAVDRHNQALLEEENVYRDRLEIVDLETGRANVIWSPAAE
jgi:hypothetical protein